MLNKIIRKGSFDAGHRVMFQRFKCAHLHGHRYDYALEFSYRETEAIGYAIDFSELKRIGCGWIEENLDHTYITNPLDKGVIDLARNLGSNIFVMHLLDANGSCNPTVENIAKEIFFAIQTLLETENLKLDQVVLNETANCIGVCAGLTESERRLFTSQNDYVTQVLRFKEKMGQIEYDSRKVEP